MLRRLTVENFLTIREAQIDFSSGITAIVGESGSGKSLILKTIESVFSPKTDTSFVGNFSDSSKISLFFQLDKNQQNRLKEFDIDTDEILLTKIIQKGRTKAYINHEPVSQRVLSNIKNLLVDIVSQEYRFEVFSNQNLLDILDRLIDKNVKDSFAESYRRFTNLKEKMEQLENRIDKINQSHPEVLLEAIEKVNPKKGEYEELLSISKRIKSIAAAKEVAQEATKLLFEDDTSVESTLSLIISKLNKLASKGIEIKSLNYLTSAIDNINLARDELYGLLNKTYSDDEIDSINHRLFELEKLQRQFGLTVDEILTKKIELLDMLKEKESTEEELKKLKEKLSLQKEEMFKNAQELTLQRKESAKQIKKQITEELKKLRLNKSRVEIKIEEKSIDDAGKDRVIVLFSANPDLPLQELKKVASGGEKSRFILALKKALCRIGSSQETVFFDEIETGLSNQTLTDVLKSIKEFASNNQIILITHNEDVKSLAGGVYLVKKEFIDNRTVSIIERLK